MESLIFSGDAFSEYYLRNLLWDEPKLRPLLGLDACNASCRRAAAEVGRAQRALRARHQARSTRTLLLTPLADILSWELGQEEETVETAEGAESAGQALRVDGRSIARVLAIEPDAPMDLPPTGIHRRFAPTLSVVRALEELNLTWAILLNAYELRLIRRAEGFVSSHVGFDLTSIAEGGQPGFDAWQLLWALLRSEALAAEPMVLERAVANGREHQAGVGAALGGQVQDAIVAFAQGIISHAANRETIPQPVPHDYLTRLYTEALRVLYRILFALYAEARSLLPLDLPTYRDAYSVTRLARRAADPQADPRRNPSTSGRYFEFSLRALFELLRQGANLGPEGRIPKYNGAMFDHGQTELVESLVWGDETIANVLEKLTLIPARTGQVRLSYRELDVEQLGAVYENLLEQIPQIASEPMFRVVLDGRELVVTLPERQRLAERRGEVLTRELAEVQGEEEEEALDEEEEPQETDENGEQIEEEEEPRRRGPAKPLRVLAEIVPGTVYLKAGMGRKQTGSFYTSRPLVEFLVRRAIDPLAEGKTPEEILALRVLDPAMGSGHFLVGASRRLGEHLLAAYRKRHEEVLTAQTNLPPGDVFLEAGVHPEVAANWEHEDRALTACRLLIAGNCIYGVDKNPLAVDLARVSLWLATAATDHPLTFLDHRLRPGDSLLGLPLYLGNGDEPEIHLLKPDQPVTRRRGRGRRTQAEDTPLLAGVSMQEIVSGATRSLRARIRRALQHLKTISELMNERPGDFAGHRLAFEAMQNELKPFWELHRLRVGREFTRPDTVAETGLVNRWLAEIAQEGRPQDEARQLAATTIRRGKEVGAFCWELAFPEVFFNEQGERHERSGFDAVIGNPPWDKIKPNERECFSDFDPTVWDVQGQDRKGLIRRLMQDNPRAREAWERHEAETTTLSKLLLDGGMYHHQIAVVEGKKTGGDPDMFKFFTERAYQLVRLEGRAGIIVPLGIQSSLGTTGLRRLLLDQCQLQALVKLDNERFIFPGVFHGQKFDLLVFAKGSRSDKFDAAFFSWEPAEVVLRLNNDPRRLTVDAELYRELSPEQYTFVELHDQREVELLRRIYRQFPRLGECREDTWNVSFKAEFHMTNGSFLFRNAARLRQFDPVLHSRLPPVTEAAQGATFEHDEGGEYWTTRPDDHYARQSQRFTRVERWVDSRGRVHPVGGIDEDKVAYRLTGYVLVGEEADASALPVKPDEKYVPLYEGRMVHQFDHCQKAYIRGSGRRARWDELPWQEKRMVGHYHMASSDFTSLHANSVRCRGTFGAVTGQANERSLLTTVVPALPCGNALPTIHADRGDPCVDVFWSAVCNSFFVDWLLRLRVSNNINFFVLESLAMPRPARWDDQSAEVIKAAARLLSSTPEMSPVWSVMAGRWPDEFPMPWTRERACLDIRERATLRAEIDARVAMLYGLSAQEYARILSTFPLLDQDQPRLPGDCFIRRTNKGEKVEPRGFITRDLALLMFFELSAQEPPGDIVAFFADAGVDIERNTGPIRNLRARVEEATRRGAVAYLPTQYKSWKPADTPFLPPDLPRELVENGDAHVGQHVVCDPQIMGGKPTLAGTRIELQLVYDLLNQGWTFSQVLESYPHLTREQVAVALRWGDLQ